MDGVCCKTLIEAGDRTVIPSWARGQRRDRTMMGRRERGQGQLFYEFNLDEVVPPDHLARQIDADCGPDEIDCKAV